MNDIINNECLEKKVVPIDIDTHLKLFGKSLLDYNYIGICPLCNGGIDDDGMCGCGSGSE